MFCLWRRVRRDVGITLAVYMLHEFIVDVTDPGHHPFSCLKVVFIVASGLGAGEVAVLMELELRSMSFQPIATGPRRHQLLHL